MTADPTNLIDAVDLRTEHLANLPPGTIVLEMLTGPSSTAGTKPGLGMVISLNGDEFLLPFTSWSSLNLQAGQLAHLSQAIGIVLPDATLSAEVDLDAPPPYALARPTGQRPPALTVKNGRALILAVQNPQQAAQSQWVAYDLKGAHELYYSSGSDSRTPLFDEWVLVLSRSGNRTEIRIK